VGRLYVAILALLGVGVLLVVQMFQGESNWGHWIGLAAIAIGLAAVGVEAQKRAGSAG
jgi:hypothetical protein